jgi:branched-chain amino acid transport system ATP-binding protein
MTSTAPLLEIKGLQAGYGEAEVLHGIDLSMRLGEFVCIIGANTAGKSTILRSVSRLVPRITGTLQFEGTDLMARACTDPRPGIAHMPRTSDFSGNDCRGKSFAWGLYVTQGRRPTGAHE